MYKIKQKNHLYKSLLRYLGVYLCFVSIIILQLAKSNIYHGIQGFIFKHTIFLIEYQQSKINKISYFISHVKNLDLFEISDKYNLLKEENIMLQNKIALQDKMISKLSHIENLLNQNINTTKNLKYIVCDVAFYLNGSSKMLICRKISSIKSSIKKNALVMNDKGLIGRVIKDYDEDSCDYIQVQLVNDSGFRIPVITSSSYIRAIAIGYGNKDNMKLGYTNVSSLINGETVFTANDGNIVVPEIPVGSIYINENGEYVIKTSNLHNLSIIKILI